jgi:transposase
LYLFSQFFDDKAIEILLGEEVESEYLNDDKIGRVMDKLYKYGLNNLFIEIVLSVIKKFQINTKYSHLDATSFHLHGELKPEEMITTYKNQQSCERGFRFIKDPLFFADSFFVKNPERIETMLFLMSLCFLVYNLGQRELRSSLKRVKIGIKNQLGKLTICPTLRWVFQCFQGIHLLTLNGINQIVNLTSERHLTLSHLPSSCQKYYLLS